MFKIKNKYLTLFVLGCLTPAVAHATPTASVLSQHGDDINFKVGKKSIVAKKEKFTAGSTLSDNKTDIIYGTSADGGVMAGCLDENADTITDHDTATVGCVNGFIRTSKGVYKLSDLMTANTTEAARANGVSADGKTVVGVSKKDTNLIHATYWNVAENGTATAKEMTHMADTAEGELSQSLVDKSSASDMTDWLSIREIQIDGITKAIDLSKRTDGSTAASTLAHVLARLQSIDEFKDHYVFSVSGNKLIIKVKGGSSGKRIKNLKLLTTAGDSSSDILSNFTAGNKSAATTTTGTNLNSWANATNKDGKYIVGGAYTKSGQKHAFYYENKAAATSLAAGTDVMHSLGTLEDGHTGNSEAKGISGDGKYVVGWSDQTNSGTVKNRAFIWERVGASGGKGHMVSLGVLTKGASVTAANKKVFESQANDVSDDGKYAVGWSHKNIAANGSTKHKRAFLWTRDAGKNGAATTGKLTDLGTLSTHAEAEAEARGISADGKVAVGWSNSGTTKDGTKRAFRWTKEDGMRDLGTLKDDNSGESEATSISDDGKIIVGKAAAEGTTGTRAFIWRANKIYDLVNSQKAVNKSAMDQTTGVGAMGGALSSALDYDFNVDTSSAGTKANAFMVSVNQTTNNQCKFIQCNDLSLNASDSKKSTPNYRANLGATYSKGKYNGLTVNSRQLNFAGFVRQPAPKQTPIMLGAFVGTGSISSTIKHFGFKGNVPSKGIYLRGLNNDGMGLTWKVGFAHAKGKANISRYELAKSDKATGTATMKSNAVSVSLGYGIKQWGVNMTPYAIIKQSKATRGAYKETSGSFPISYSAFTTTTRTIQPGVRGETKINNDSSLSWNVGVIHRMSQKSNKATGTSKLVGFEKFNLKAPKKGKSNRATVSFGYNYNVKDDMKVYTNVNATKAAHGNKTDRTYTIGFRMGL